MTTFRLFILMDVPSNLFEEWADWNSEHARDVVRDGHISGQTFKVRTDFSYVHPELLEGRPPYTMVNAYEVDDATVEGRLTKKTPEMGQGPAVTTRPFPSPLGKHMGDGYLLEPVSEKFHGSSPNGDQLKYLLITLMEVPPELSDEWTDWFVEHARDMVTAPGFLSGQTYRVRTDYSYIHPESLPDRPPYTMVNVYEVDDRAVQTTLAGTPKTGGGPTVTKRPFPSPLGETRADTYLMEPISERYCRAS